MNSKEKNKSKKYDEWAAGLLVFRVHKDNFQFLLAHPSNNNNAAYGIPKGHIDNKDKNILITAVRETHEETGVIAKPIARLRDFFFKKRGGIVKKLTIFLAVYESGVDENGISQNHDWEN